MSNTDTLDTVQVAQRKAAHDSITEILRSKWNTPWAVSSQ